jgi:hypothetical protein
MNLRQEERRRRRGEGEEEEEEKGTEGGGEEESSRRGGEGVEERSGRRPLVCNQLGFPLRPGGKLLGARVAPVLDMHFSPAAHTAAGRFWMCGAGQLLCMFGVALLAQLALFLAIRRWCWLKQSPSQL